MFSNFSLYGEALKELFKSVFNGTVILSPVDDAYNYAFKNTDGKIKFPFVSLYPNSNILLDKANISFPSYKEGLPFENPLELYTETGKSKGTTERLAKNTKFLYIIIGYQIEVWRYR